MGQELRLCKGAYISPNFQRRWSSTDSFLPTATTALRFAFLPLGTPGANQSVAGYSPPRMGQEYTVLNLSTAFVKTGCLPWLFEVVYLSPRIDHDEVLVRDRIQSDDLFETYQGSQSSRWTPRLSMDRPLLSALITLSPDISRCWFSLLLCQILWFVR